MTFVPRLTRVVEGGELVAITLGHRLLDDYLEFVAARGARNTWLATAYDLKVFFEVVGGRAGGGDGGGRVRVLGRAAQSAPRRDGGADRGRRGGAGGAHDRQAPVERGGLV